MGCAMLHPSYELSDVMASVTHRAQERGLLLEFGFKYVSLVSWSVMHADLSGYRSFNSYT